jgi:hypothetical protein
MLSGWFTMESVYFQSIFQSKYTHRFVLLLCVNPQLLLCVCVADEISPYF